MHEYGIREGYRDKDFLRNAFFDFIDRIYPGLDFKIWYEKGFWLDNYIPHSIVIDDKIVSNASITKMALLVDGNIMKGIQVGTVGTLPEYRRRGLSRILMQHILNKYSDSMEIIFLYSSKEALSFYPKFGFDHYNEVIFRQTQNIPEPDYSARKLDIGTDRDFSLMREILGRRTPVSRLFGALDYDFITIWHILNLHPNHLYYLEKEGIIIIASESNNQIHIWDVIYDKPMEIQEALPQIIKSEDIKSINFYFSPDLLGFNYDDTIVDSESPLFVKGTFPIGGRKFKFPSTAQT
ncbi:MAG: GNAT family N-acetyltransferase [candidate division Zixibacteria bacterium]|nr:GNAT family N-acetyltransferase [candidate division Zixibacteria bacterium]